MPAIDVARFREVVGHFASGVVVITAMTENGPVGFTCQSFGSLSLEPILVSFAARTDGNSWPKIQEVGTLAVNVLSSRQETIARVFATSEADKFIGVPWTPGVLGAPIIADSLAHLEGHVVSVNSFGDHDVVVVGVEHVLSRDGLPLVYFRGGFGSFAV